MTTIQLRDELLVANHEFGRIVDMGVEALGLARGANLKKLLADIVEVARDANSTSSHVLLGTEDPAPQKLPYDPSLAAAYGTSLDLNLALAQLRSAMNVLSEPSPWDHRIDWFSLLVAVDKIIEYRRDITDEVETVLADAMEAEADHD